MSGIGTRSIFKDIIIIKRLFDKAKIRTVYFILPICLGLLTSFLEGFSIVLLIPLAKGIVNADFGFARELPGLKVIIHKFLGFFEESNFPLFILLVIVILIATVLKNSFRYFSMLTAKYQAVTFSSRIKELVFRRYLSFGKLFFDRANVGHLQILLVRFTDAITRQVFNIINAVSWVFLLIVYFSLMCALSWKLTLVILIIFPAMNYFFRWLGRKVRRTSKFEIETRSRLNKWIFNRLSCMPLIKANMRQEAENKKFADLCDNLKGWIFSIEKKRLFRGPVQEIVMVVVALLLLSFIFFIVPQGENINISVFLVYFYVFRKCMPAFSVVGQVRVNLMAASGAINKVLEVFSDKDKFFIPEGNKEFNGLKKYIQFNNLNFSYANGMQILKDVSFRLEKSKVTAVVGPTGAGKTTLISLLLRFYDTSPGSVTVDDIDIREFSLKSLRRHMAWVSQDTLLFNDTLRENISYGINRSVPDQELIEIAKKACLYDFIMKLPQGLDTFIGDRGVKLSGGEKQRVAIARALLKGAEILILDEATSSLDSTTERLIQEAVNEAVKGRTAIVIAHRLSTVRNADKVVVIEEGRLLEQGTLNELLAKKGKFYEYWQEQKFD